MAARGGSLKVSIVGAGSVGTALAALLRKKRVRVVSVVSRRISSARRVASLVGCRRFSRRLADLHPDTNLLLLTAPESELPQIVRQIATDAPLHYHALYAALTSGVLTSDVLAPLARRGATVFSFHPIQSFPGVLSPVQRVKALDGISYGVEGPPKGINFARRFARRIGGNILQVPKEEKILYHLACAIASNYSVALLGAVEELARGFSRSAPLAHFAKLIRTSIDNALRLSPRKALTGPIARGDLQTVRKHLRKLVGKRKHLQRVYQSLGQIALDLTAKEGRLSTRQIRDLQKLLRQ